MGKRGPAPKPDALVTKINRSKRGSNLADGIKPDVATPDCPAWLCVTGKNEWVRIVPHLQKCGLLSHLDMAALVLYCQSYGRYVELENGMTARIAQLQKDERLEYIEAVHRAFIDTTPNGYNQVSALASTIRNLKEEVLRYLAQFGMSPSSRTRVVVSNQPELPGIPAASQEEGWGAFSTH